MTWRAKLGRPYGMIVLDVAAAAAPQMADCHASLNGTGFQELNANPGMFNLYICWEPFQESESAIAEYEFRIDDRAVGRAVQVDPIKSVL